MAIVCINITGTSYHVGIKFSNYWQYLRGGSLTGVAARDGDSGGDTGVSPRDGGGGGDTGVSARDGGGGGGADTGIH